MLTPSTKTKVNRPDGSFATSDLFEPHPTIPNAWRYHSRADCQLALITGKKFDPAHIEAKISSLPLIADAFVFGQDRPYPGALLFPCEAEPQMSVESLTESIWLEIQTLNANNPPHARLSRGMILIGSSGDLPLEKSSKGTLLRGQIEKRFAKRIADAYGDGNMGVVQTNGEILGVDISDEEILHRIETIARSVLGRPEKLDQRTDLFHQGIDSVASMQIRNSIGKVFRSHQSPHSMWIFSDAMDSYSLSRRLFCR